MLQELRVLLPGSQTLTAFLVILPFNSGFSQIQDEERYVYLAAFLCSLLSLILFTAPAAHHRIQRPLRDRAQFKTISTRLMVAGSGSADGGAGALDPARDLAGDPRAVGLPDLRGRLCWW